MKQKIMIGVLLIASLMVVGCVDYKDYDIQEDDDLLSEIAQLEQEVMEQEDLMEETTAEEEVVLPELSNEEPVELTSEEMRVISVKENQLVKLNVQVEDPDEDPVEYSFTAPLSKEGEWQTNYGDAGEYVVTLSATDGLLTSEEKVRIVVERVNVAPTVTGLRDITVDEGEVVEVNPNVNDPNGDAVNVEVSAPLSEGVFATDHTSAGEYQITVTASDGELTTEERFTLTINDVNELPVVENIEDITLLEGETVEIMPEVSDLDGDNVEVTISEPIGDDGVWETTFTDHGEYKVVVRADDGKDVVTRQITVIVEDVNKAPRIIDISLAGN